MAASCSQRADGAWTNGTVQTVKSRGLDTPTLVSSAMRVSALSPWWPTSPVHQGEREAADKPTAQGMPDDRLNLWYLPPAFLFAGGPWVAASTRHSLRPLR